MQEPDTGLENLILACLNERTGLSGRVRVSQSGCLDPCARGTAVVVLPGFYWYGGVTLADADRIIAEHLAGMVPAPGSDIQGATLR